MLPLMLCVVVLCGLTIVLSEPEDRIGTLIEAVEFLVFAPFFFWLLGWAMPYIAAFKMWLLNVRIPPHKKFAVPVGTAKEFRVMF